MTSSAGQWQRETRAGGAELSCGRHETLEGPLGAACEDPSSPAGTRGQDPSHWGVAGPSRPDSCGSGKQLLGLLSAGGWLWWGGGLCLGVGSSCVPWARMALGEWQCRAARGQPPSSGLPGPAPADNGRTKGGIGAVEPVKLLGTIPSQRAQHCVLGVPAEVWELHSRSLWQQDSCASVGWQDWSIWHCWGNYSPAFSGQNAALSHVRSRSHAAILLSVHLPVSILLSTHQGCLPVAPRSLLGLLPPEPGVAGSQPGVLPAPNTISHCSLLQT